MIFGAYRVFGCEGSTMSDIMLAAMERALADGMQVLNISIGAAYVWPQYPTAQAADRLVNKGIVVVASIGNNGANGLYSAGSPGLGKKVIGVASFDNTSIWLNYFTLSPDDMQIGYAPATGAPLPPTSGTSEMARTGTPQTTDDACSPLTAGSLTGKIALIRRGTCSFYTKAFYAQQAGAIGVVIYNNNAGRFSPTVAGTPAITIPVVAVSDTEGTLIDSRFADGSVELTWTSERGSFPNPTGGLISTFSSYGLSPDLSLKPDIGAPGGNIFSTYPLEKNDGYASLSGTSMSSPHVAGAVSLLLQAKPKTNAQIVRTILQNSADPKPWWGNPGLGFLDNVHRQGAGMLDIDDAIRATTMIEPGKISVGESEDGPATRTLTIENKGSSAVTYDLSFVNALSTGDVIVPSFWLSDAEVAFNTTSVVVPAGGKSSVLATIFPATGPDKGQYGGYMVFTPQEGGQVYRVPFAGFVGDYQNIQSLEPTSYGFPWLSAISGGNYTKIINPTNKIFTMQGDDIPYFLVHFEHQVRTFRIEIFAAGSGKSWHRAYTEDYVPRNSSSSGFFVFPFDGTTFAGKKSYTVPDGTYYARISALKPLGDDNNVDHWEIWTSPTFLIDRP